MRRLSTTAPHVWAGAIWTCRRASTHQAQACPSTRTQPPPGLAHHVLFRRQQVPRQRSLLRRVEGCSPRDRSIGRWDGGELPPGGRRPVGVIVVPSQRHSGNVRALWIQAGPSTRPEPLGGGKPRAGESSTATSIMSLVGGRQISDGVLYSPSKESFRDEIGGEVTMGPWFEGERQNLARRRPQLKGASELRVLLPFHASESVVVHRDHFWLLARQDDVDAHVGDSQDGL
jgi:hypothetical protein